MANHRGTVQELAARDAAMAAGRASDPPLVALSYAEWQDESRRREIRDTVNYTDGLVAEFEITVWPRVPAGRVTTHFRVGTRESVERWVRSYFGTESFTCTPVAGTVRNRLDFTL